jgi:hypothetical protein
MRLFQKNGLEGELKSMLKWYQKQPIYFDRKDSEGLKCYNWSYGVMVSTLDSESNNPSSNLGRTFFLQT